MSDTYEIRTIADFLKVPDEKLDECLADFREWLRLRRKSEELNGLVKEMTGADAVEMGDVMTWRDDGRRGVSAISLSANDQPIGTIEFPDDPEA